ncbi:MAG: hypothetical protein IJM65_03520, partial [Bacteroidales bacterium]|nr:hypothetical protein [Bacteroidales bacterium]
MKKSVVKTVLVLLLCGMAGFASAGNSGVDPKRSYEDLWKSYAESIEKDLPESAAKTLDEIESKALKENNQTQLLKSWLMRSSVFYRTSENNPQQTYIRYLESKTGQLDAVHNALLHEEIAQEYAEFWRNWKWDIKLNLPIEGDVSKVEMKYWDEESFRSRIDAHFAEAIKPVEALKQAETKDFLLILNVSTKEVEKYLDYEKTLYEFMFHRMANIYMNKAGRDDVEEGMNSDNWWQPAKDFVNVELNGNADNPLIKCLKIYQELIAYHLESGNEDALIYNDFKRYGFVNSIFSDFNRFQIAMDDLRNRYADNPLSAEITALMANNLIDQYERKSSDSIYFDNYRKAKELCEQVIAKFPKTTGAENCQNLVKHIVEPKISLRMHEVQLPGEAIPAVLEYRNAFRPYYRIVKVSEKEVERLIKKNKEELLKELDSKPSVTEQELTLATETDYRTHKTLIAIPKLERGCYFLIAGTQKKIKNKEMRLALLFQVSSLGYIDEKTEDNKLIVITVDRKTGKTVEGVTVEFYKENYRSQTNILATKQSDRNGRAEFTCKKNGIFIGFNLRKGDDCLYSFDNRKFYNSEESGEGIIGTHFFTDRAIYRPGQTVHFQGIVTRSDDEDKNVELVKGYTEIISLLDANRQEIASTEFVTDEYGSFSGSFVLPTDRMNGRYVLRSKTVLIYIRVEEYKRPTFELNFEKPKEKYMLNEDVTIHGDVKAYAGFGLDDVECSYRVVRKTSFPWRCWWWNYPSVLDEQIASGKSRTDENGKFAINFNLKPSQTIAPERQPLYTYEIEVTATSRQGETQTGTYSIRAGYNEIALSTDLPSEVEQSDMRKYKISVGNLSGEPAKSRILRKIYRCAEASMPNYFDAVFEYNNVKLDRQLLSDEELERLFPNYSFYPLKGSASSNGSMTLLSQKQISVYDTGTLYDGQSLKPGVYVVELVSLDDSLAKISKQFTVYEKESKKMPVNALVWAHADKQTANPGEKIQFAIGSSAKNVEIWVQLLHGSEVRIDRRITVSNSVQTIPYEVTENDRGALTWRYAMVKENSFRTKNVYVSVPFDNYDLDVKLATVRDRLNPGAEEKWEVTVRDYKDKPLEAALLAGMYDASLDVFVQNEWEFSMSPNISSYHSRWLGLSYFHTIFSVTENNNYNYHFTQPFNFRLPSDFPYVVYMVDGVRSEKKSLAGYLYLAGHNKKAAMNAEENVFYCVEQAEPMADRSLGMWPEMEEKKSQQPAEPTLRENFNETAFFFPQLRTNADGSATFSFTMPDALTRWKLMLLAYTKERQTGYKEYTFTSSKPVMIMADMPRYIYDNDTIWMVANVINTGEEAVTPKAKLEIFDAA